MGSPVVLDGDPRVRAARILRLVGGRTRERLAALLTLALTHPGEVVQVTRQITEDGVVDRGQQHQRPRQQAREPQRRRGADESPAEPAPVPKPRRAVHGNHVTAPPGRAPRRGAVRARVSGPSAPRPALFTKRGAALNNCLQQVDDPRARTAAAGSQPRRGTEASSNRV